VESRSRGMRSILGCECCLDLVRRSPSLPRIRGSKTPCEIYTRALLTTIGSDQRLGLVRGNIYAGLAAATFNRRRSLSQEFVVRINLGGPFCGASITCSADWVYRPYPGSPLESVTSTLYTLSSAQCVMGLLRNHIRIRLPPQMVDQDLIHPSGVITIYALLTINRSRYVRETSKQNGGRGATGRDCCEPGRLGQQK
jgi:hypothetical protein